MRISIGKRQIIPIAIIIALGAAIFLNWQFSGIHTVYSSNQKRESGSAPANASYEDYFASARLSREQAVAQAQDLLNTELSSTSGASVSASAQQTAGSALNVIDNTLSEEKSIETAIKGKGYADCVVFINNGTVNLVVRPKTDSMLSEAQAEQLYAIVAQQTKPAPDAIRIIQYTD